MKRWFIKLEDLTGTEITTLVSKMKELGACVTSEEGEDCIGNFVLENRVSCDPSWGAPELTLDYWHSQDFQPHEEVTFQEAMSILEKVCVEE